MVQAGLGVVRVCGEEDAVGGQGDGKQIYILCRNLFWQGNGAPAAAIVQASLRRDVCLIDQAVGFYDILLP